MQIWLLIGFGFISSVFAATEFGNYHNPANPGKCTLTKYGFILSPGERGRLPYRCGDVECLDVRGEAIFYTCGVYQTPTGCRMVGLAAPYARYPKCCKPNYVCPKQTPNRHLGT